MADDLIGFDVEVNPPSASLAEQEAALVTQAEENAAKIEAAYGKIEAAGEAASKAGNLQEVDAATRQLQEGVEELADGAQRLSDHLDKARTSATGLGEGAGETDKRIADLSEELRRLASSLDKADDKIEKGQLRGLQTQANSAELAIKKLDRQISELAQRGIGITPAESARLAQLRERYDALKGSIALATRAQQEAKDAAAGASAALTREQTEVEQLREQLRQLEAILAKTGEAIRRNDIGNIGRQAQSAEFALGQLKARVAESLAANKPIDPQVLSSLKGLEDQVARNVKVAAAAKEAQDKYGDSLAAAQIRAGDFSGGVGGITKAIDALIPGFESLAVQLGFIALGSQVAIQVFTKLRQVGNELSGELSGNAHGFDDLIKRIFQLDRSAENYVETIQGVRDESHLAANESNILAKSYEFQGRSIRGASADMETLAFILRRNTLLLGSQADAIRELRGQFDQVDVKNLSEQITRVTTALAGIQRGTNLGQAEKQLHGVTDELLKISAEAKRVGEALPRAFYDSLNAVNQSARGLRDGTGSVRDVQRAIDDLAAAGEAAGPRIGAAVRGNLEALRGEADKLGAGNGSVSQLNHQLKELRDAAIAVEGPLKEGTVKALDLLIERVGTASQSFKELGIASVEDLAISERAVRDFVKASGDLLNQKQAQLVADQITKLRQAYELLPPAARAAAAAQIKELNGLSLAAAKAGAEVRDGIRGALLPESLTAQFEKLRKHIEDLGGAGTLTAKQLDEAARETSRLLTEAEQLGPVSQKAAREAIEGLQSLRGTLGRLGADFDDQFGRLIPDSIRGSVKALQEFARDAGGPLGITAVGAGKVRDRAEELRKKIEELGPVARKSLQDQVEVVQNLIDVYGKLSEEGKKAAEDLAKSARTQLDSVVKAYESAQDALAKARADFAKGFEDKKKPGQDPRDIAKQVEELENLTVRTADQQTQLGALEDAYRQAGGAAAEATAQRQAESEAAAEQIEKLDALNKQLQGTYAGQEGAIGAQGEAINRVSNSVIEGLKDTAKNGKLTAEEVDRGFQTIQDAYDGVHAGGEAVREQLGQIGLEAEGLTPKLNEAGKGLPDYIESLKKKAEELEKAVRDVNAPAKEFAGAANDIAEGTKASASAADNLKQSSEAARQSLESSSKGVATLFDSTEQLAEKIPELAKTLTDLGEVSTGIEEKLGPVAKILDEVGKSIGETPDKLAKIADALERIAKVKDQIEATARGLKQIREEVEKFSDKDIARIDKLVDAYDRLKDAATSAAQAAASVPV